MDKGEDLRGFMPWFLLTEVVGLVGVILMAVWTAKYLGGFSWGVDPSTEFNLHPLLMTIGLIYLYANAILVYRALRTMPKKTLKIIHGLIHLVVIVLVIFGAIAVLDFKNYSSPQGTNFYTIHSWLGIVTVVVYLLQWVVGLTAFLWPGYPMHMRGKILPVHVFLGLMAFASATATVLTGINEKALFTSDYSSFGTETFLINIMGLLFLVFGGMVMYLTTEPRFKRAARPEDAGGHFFGSS